MLLYIISSGASLSILKKFCARFALLFLISKFFVPKNLAPHCTGLKPVHAPDHTPFNSTGRESIRKQIKNIFFFIFSTANMGTPPPPNTFCGHRLKSNFFWLFSQYLGVFGSVKTPTFRRRSRTRGLPPLPLCAKSRRFLRLPLA